MIHLGVAYYPEHWPAERWPEDARWMVKAGISVVRELGGRGFAFYIQQDMEEDEAQNFIKLLNAEGKQWRMAAIGGMRL